MIDDRDIMASVPPGPGTMHLHDKSEKIFRSWRRHTWGNFPGPLMEVVDQPLSAVHRQFEELVEFVAPGVWVEFDGTSFVMRSSRRCFRVLPSSNSRVPLLTFKSIAS